MPEPILSVTAVDISLGRLELRRGGNMLRVERSYEYLDAEGNIVPELGVGLFVCTIPVSEIPDGMLTVLQRIDDWTKQKILAGFQPPADPTECRVY